MIKITLIRSMLLLNGILLSSCSQTNQPKISISTVTRDFSNNSDLLEDYLIQLDVDSFSSLVDSGQDFIVYYSDVSCHLCTQVKPNFINYVKQYNTQMYFFKYVNVVNELEVKYPQLHKDFRGTPTLKLISNGQMIGETIGTQRLSSVNRINSFINGYTKRDNLNYIYNINTYKQKIDEGKSVVILDKTISEQSLLFNNEYYSSLTSLEDEVFVYDLSDVGYESIESNANEIGYDFSTIAIANKEKGLTYHREDLIKNYFNV